MTWISKDEYDALPDDSESVVPDSHSVNALQVTSGQVLESHASPFTLVQKDFQGNALVEDTLTESGLNEIENSNKFIQYTENVNSTLTEVAPNITTSSQQTQSYSESYQTKTEDINAQIFVRDTQSLQYNKVCNNLNLNAPTCLSQTAAQSITRNINTRNLSVEQHSMRGQNYQANYGKLNLSSGMTVINVKGHCQLGAKNLSFGDGNAAPQPVKPRRAPPDVIAKVSGNFGSKTISLPPAYDANYMIQIDLTLSGDYEMESVNSVNPLTLTPDGIQAQVSKTLGDFFFGMQVEQKTGVGSNQGSSPTFTIGNQYGSYTLTDGINITPPTLQAIILQYSTSISEDKNLVNLWLLTLSATLEAVVMISRRDFSENMISRTDDMRAALRDLASDAYNQLSRLINYSKATINAMYEDAEFLDTLAIDGLLLSPK